jgi:hypothetical protein
MIIPEVLFPEDPIVIIRPIVTSNMGQLKTTLSIISGKIPVFLNTRNNPAITRMTPIIALLCSR